MLLNNLVLKLKASADSCKR